MVHLACGTGGNAIMIKFRHASIAVAAAMYDTCHNDGISETGFLNRDFQVYDGVREVWCDLGVINTTDREFPLFLVLKISSVI